MRGKLAKALRAFAKERHKEREVEKNARRGNMEYPLGSRRDIYQSLKIAFKTKGR